MASFIAPEKNGNKEGIKGVCIPHQHSFGDAELNCQDIRPTSLGISHLWEDFKCKVFIYAAASCRTENNKFLCFYPYVDMQNLSVAEVKNLSLYL